MHDELALLVSAGLSPAGALRTATINAAKFMALQDDYGSVATGKAADLILLRSNPLEDIGNIRDIDAVFVSGRYLDRDALDQLLMFAEKRAASPHNNVQILWAALLSPLVRLQFAD